MIYDKLFKIQEEAHKFIKDSTNPHFKNTYLSLRGLMAGLSPILTEHKLLVVHHTENGEVVTTVRDMEDKSEFSSAMPIPDGIEPQKQGSCVTYFRRYNLEQIFGIVTEDDDGNATQTKKPKSVKEATGDPLVDDNFEI